MSEGDRTNPVLFLAMLLLILQVAEGTDRPLKEVPASEILTNISKGLPVEYDHIIVTENLSLNNLKGLPTRHVDRADYEKKYLGASEDIKIITSPIRISDSVIDGTVRFNNTILENIADFTGSKFNSYADFEYSKFNSDAYFSYSKFNSYAYFMGSKFNSSADFRDSKFNSYAYFGYSKFNSSADFGISQFNNSTKFDSAVFLAFVPTEQDNKWAASVVDNAKIIASDFSLMGSAAENSDFAAVRNYCEYAKIDVSNALEDSKSYTVSNELQNAKKYYEQGLNEYYLGATLTISGIDELDASKIKTAMIRIQSGTRYLQLATKEINDLMGA